VIGTPPAEARNPADLRGSPLMQRDRKGHAEWAVLLAAASGSTGAPSYGQFGKADTCARLG